MINITVWITNNLGIKKASDELEAENFGSVIVDMRDINEKINLLMKDIELIKADPEQMKLYNDHPEEAFTISRDEVVYWMSKVINVLAQRKLKVILQDEDTSLTIPFAAASLVYAINISYDEALSFIGNKCSIEINDILMRALKTHVSFS